MKTSNIIFNKFKYFNTRGVDQEKLTSSKYNDIRELNSQEIQVISGAPELQNDPE